MSKITVAKLFSNNVLCASFYLYVIIIGAQGCSQKGEELADRTPKIVIEEFHVADEQSLGNVALNEDLSISRSYALLGSFTLDKPPTKRGDEIVAIVVTMMLPGSKRVSVANGSGVGRWIKDAQQFEFKCKFTSPKTPGDYPIEILMDGRTIARGKATVKA